MISLKKYLDAVQTGSNNSGETEETDILSAAIAAYRSALLEMGNCSVDACSGLGEELKHSLGKLEAKLSAQMSSKDVAATEKNVQEQLQGWGRRAARHYQEKTGEVKELLIVMARTAESVGARDQRCAGQINEVTARLTTIASLDNLTEIRASIEKSAADLKTSIKRMTEEGKAALDHLRTEVSNYQEKLEKAEEIASRDALTGLHNRLLVENQIERRIAAGTPFCVAIVDIDGFKKVNDEHGHLTGDELLKQFATELKSACRSTDLIGRWGGDEFIILLDYGLSEANAQTERLSKWVCGDYTVQGNSGPKKIRVDASIGLAEHVPGEAMKKLLARADTAMYRNKAESRAAEGALKQ
ncbi:MAG: GGDEF domain-containing protein [Terracidiphilus sp.]|nr:GGDEF domain-containing protein [Terracidiphilus sp.]